MAKQGNILLIGGGALVVGLLYTSFKKKKALASADLSNILRWTGTAKAQAEAVENVDYPTVLAIIWQESSGRINASHSSGERGLMGLKPVAFQEMGEEPTTEPTKNIEVGTRFLSKIVGLTNGDLKRALRSYNKRGTNVEGLTLGEGEKYAREVLEKKKVIESKVYSPSLMEEILIGGQVSGMAGVGKALTDSAKTWFNETFGT